MTLADSVAELARDVFARHCGPEVVAEAEGSWAPALWDVLTATGLTEVGSGDGGGWSEIAAVATAAGASTAPVPLIETILARRLLEDVGLAAPSGPLSIATASGARASRVPWARFAAALVLVDDGRLWLVGRERYRLEHGLSLAREPRDEVVADLDGAPSRPVSGDAFLCLGALFRSLQIAGALERVRSLTFDYAGTREQFGRPIARFQAVQHNLALLAGEAVAAAAASSAAIEALEARGIAACTAEISAAKVRAGLAASEGARLAHQIHGAIGVTYEHQLHHFTTRLWTWRDEYGNERYWATRLGHALSGTGDAYWDRLTM